MLQSGSVQVLGLYHFDILWWLSGGHATFTPFQVYAAFSVLFGSVYIPTHVRTESQRHAGTHRRSHAHMVALILPPHNLLHVELLV